MKNKVLILFALWLLSMVDKRKIQYKNSWNHYLREIKNFTRKEEKRNISPEAYRYIFDNGIKDLKKEDFLVNGKEPKEFEDLGNGSYYVGKPEDWK